MSDTEQNENDGKKTHWRALADLLGAPAPAEETPVDESAPGADEDQAVDPVETSERELDVEPESPKSTRTPPSRPPSDWYGLASELGIEVELPPPPAVDEPESAESDLKESQPAEPSTDSDSESDSEADSGMVVQLEFEVASGDEPGREVLDRDDVFRELTDFEADDASEASDTASVDESRGDESEADLDAATESGDVSEESESEPEVRAKRRRRRSRRRSTPAGRERSETEEAAQVSDSTDEAEAVSDTKSDSDSDSGDEEPAEGTRKRRSRRRRRRPRTDDESVEVEVEVEADQGQESREGGDDQDEDDSESRVRPKGEASGRSKHRKIPTWEEAITVIVDSNLESRSKSSSSNPKGRSRGSRRRKS